MLALVGQVIFNNGVWGGSKAAVQDVLAGMLSHFSTAYSRTVKQGVFETQSFDIAAMNVVVLQQAAYTWQIFSGRPFCAGQVRMCMCFWEWTCTCIQCLHS